MYQTYLGLMTYDLPTPGGAMGHQPTSLKTLKPFVRLPAGQTRVRLPSCISFTPTPTLSLDLRVLP